MAVMIYENRRLVGGSIGMLVRTAVMTILGMAMILFALVAVGYGLLEKAGVIKPTRGVFATNEAPTPLWGHLLFGAGLIGIGAFALTNARDSYRHYVRARQFLASGQPLAMVEGHPRFTFTEDGPRGPTELSVGHKRFDLTDASRRGGKSEEYSWGESTTIRGELCAYYVPDTGTLVRAEWRPYDGSQINRIIDEIIRANLAWAPNIQAMVPAAAQDPHIFGECQRVVASFQKLIQEDCQRLADLRPRLLPNETPRRRRKAEEDFTTIIERMRLTKTSVSVGLKAVRKATG